MTEQTVERNRLVDWLMLIVLFVTLALGIYFFGLGMVVLLEMIL